MLGKLEQFDTVNGSWVQYCEIIEQFFIVNDITDANKKRAVLLSSIGSKAYALLRDLCSPTLPSAKNYTELTIILSQHLNPKPLVIAERFKFHKRDQLPSESVAQYVASLNKLTEFCEFGTFRDQALRDRFVCGLQIISIQKRLLTEIDLTFDKAVQLAVSLETAENKSVELQPHTNVSVNKLKTKRSRQPNSVRKEETVSIGSKGTGRDIICFCCGKLNHKSPQCKYKQYTCEKCKGAGTSSHYVWKNCAFQGKEILKCKC